MSDGEKKERNEKIKRKNKTLFPISSLYKY